MALAGCQAAPPDVNMLAEAAPIADGPLATPPSGFVNFCMRSPQACTSDVQEAKVQLTQQTLNLLVAVNDKVNDSIVYMSDPDHYGRPNQWTLQPEGGYGDCKDYALAKQKALRDAGLPGSALRIAVVRTPQSELHAVLTVDTDKGAIVLDSLTSDIRPWSDTPYQWLERQASDSPLHWVWMPEDIRTAFAGGRRG